MVMKDKWDDIFRVLGFDCTQPMYSVTADQIKSIAHEEPRLMSSMDSESKLPRIFRQHGLFMLPVGDSKYVLVKGNGFHELEEPGEPQRFEARFEMDKADLAYGTGENRFLLQGFHSGLLEHFAQVPRMYEGPSGKVRSGQWSFRVDGSPPLEVDGAGIEIDRSYLSPESILIFEAKAAIPRTFLIRQLYYPYRDMGNRLGKPVRAFFFAADQTAKTYNLWEYRWQDPMNYGDIRLVRKGSFVFEEEEPPIEALESIEPDNKLDIVPQADDFQKVADYPFIVQSGIDTAKAWSDRYGIALRQGDYYKEAAEALGLLAPQEGRFILTKEGQRYLNMEPKLRGDFLAERILRIPLMNEVFRLAQKKPTGVGKEDIVRLIGRRTFTGTTPGRRASTVLSWFKWLSRATGAVVVHEGRIYPRPTGLERFG